MERQSVTVKQKIVIWGISKRICGILENCQTLSAYDVLGFIDNKPEKVDVKWEGKEIFSPEILNEILPDKIVILANAYDAIYKQIINEFPHFEGKVEGPNFFIKQSILKRYENNNEKEITEIIDYIKENDLKIFNYDFCEKYENIQIQLYWDKVYKMYYVLHHDKKLYFSRKINTEEYVRKYYSSILMEQDEKSPHRYLTPDFNIEEGNIVIDAGAAEGYFALEIIDKVKKIYLIEADKDWIEALKITFKDYEDKVVIIKAFLSSYDEGDITCLDTLIKEPIDFLKMDIEGSELDALFGAKEVIKNSPKMKLAACTYHSDYDFLLLETFMKKNKFDYKPSSGYMWFPYTTKQSRVSVQLNRALIKGILK